MYNKKIETFLLSHLDIYNYTDAYSPELQDLSGTCSMFEITGGGINSDEDFAGNAYDDLCDIIEHDADELKKLNEALPKGYSKIKIKNNDYYNDIIVSDKTRNYLISQIDKILQFHKEKGYLKEFKQYSKKTMHIKSFIANAEENSLLDKACAKFKFKKVNSYIGNHKTKINTYIL